jgi:3-dehydroquinate dehydratase
VLEANISIIHSRDECHRHIFVAAGVICGPGPYGNIAAMRAARMK